MCGRFAIMYDPEEVKDMLALEEVPTELVRNDNISPGQKIPVIIDSIAKKVDFFRWGLVPSWAKDPSIGYKMFNARSETLIEKPSFRNALLHRRCLIPASGFYEWKAESEYKQPYLFQLNNSGLFTFAGLWERWQDVEGAELFSCTIITTSPNPLVAMYHDRMPVILDPEKMWKWLEPKPVEELYQLLQPYPAEKMAAPIRISPQALR